MTIVIGRTGVRNLCVHAQLIWHKGTFDVNDLMNNTIGALVGGVIAVAVMVCYKKQK